MSRYIDAEALTRDLIDNRSFYPAIVKRAIENAPTVDVVPRSEVEELKVELEAMRGAANSYKLHYEKAKQEVAREILDKIGIAFKKIEPSYIDEYFEVVFKDFTTELNKIYDEYLDS